MRPLEVVGVDELLNKAQGARGRRPPACSIADARCGLFARARRRKRMVAWIDGIRSSRSPSTPLLPALWDIKTRGDAFKDVRFEVDTTKTYARILKPALHACDPTPPLDAPTPFRHAWQQLDRALATLIREAHLTAS